MSLNGHGSLDRQLGCTNSVHPGLRHLPASLWVLPTSHETPVPCHPGPTPPLRHSGVIHTRCNPLHLRPCSSSCHNSIGRTSETCAPPVTLDVHSVNLAPNFPDDARMVHQQPSSPTPAPCLQTSVAPVTRTSAGADWTVTHTPDECRVRAAPSAPGTPRPASDERIKSVNTHPDAPHPQDSPAPMSVISAPLSEYDSDDYPDLDYPSAFSDSSDDDDAPQERMIPIINPSQMMLSRMGDDPEPIRDFTLAETVDSPIQDHLESAIRDDPGKIRDSTLPSALVFQPLVHDVPEGVTPTTMMTPTQMPSSETTTAPPPNHPPPSDDSAAAKAHADIPDKLPPDKLPPDKQQSHQKHTSASTEVCQANYTNIEFNQIITRSITPPTNIISAELSPSKRRLAKIELGLQAGPQGAFSWQLGLLDSGCTDNLIGIKPLQAMSDFGNIKITPVNTQLLTASHNTQEVLGQCTLLVTLMSDNAQAPAIRFRSKFYIVSDLTHDIFIGQSLLASDFKVLETNTHVHFTDDPDASHRKRTVVSIPKIYPLKTTKATTRKRTALPPGSAKRIKIQCDNLIIPDNQFLTFQPADELAISGHLAPVILPQTIVNPKNGLTTIHVINPHDKPICIRPQRIGTIHSEYKEGCHIQSIDSLMSTDASSTECNHMATTQDMTTHKQSPSEIDKQKSQFRNEGFFQKSVTEVVNSNNRLATMHSENINPIPKTDDELLADCKLDHLTPNQQTQVLDMLRRNIDCFQRHKLDIGLCKDVIASIPLTEPNPPTLYAKYVPIPLKYKQQAQSLIDSYVAAGVLKQTTERCTFTSNIFIWSSNKIFDFPKS